jgi:hypothetical protein
MGKRKTLEQFVQEVYSLVKNEYVVNGEYVNSETKIDFTHNIEGCMHQFSMKPSNFLSGQRCPVCARRHTDALAKYGNIFCKDVENMTNGEYIVVGKYSGVNEKIKIKHLKCGTIFEMTPSHFKQGQRCTNKECLHDRWSDACASAKGNSFNEKFKPYEDEYIALSKYERFNKKMKFKHKTCGCEFERTPNSFFNDKNNIYNIKCPDCLKNFILQMRTKTQDDFEKEVYDLYGDEYSVVGKYINNNTKVKMRHNVCNHVWDVTPSNFLSHGNQTGCPNCKTSKGERKIKQFLESNNIIFVPQKSFDGLVGIGGKLLSYDFHVPYYNMLIEFQGKQHENPVDVFGGQEQFKVQQEHDRRKREYARLHGITLIEIWYYDIDNIEDILLNYLNLYDKKEA